jgi:hypothetical protein
VLCAPKSSSDASLDRMVRGPRRATQVSQLLLVGKRMDTQRLEQVPRPIRMVTGHETCADRGLIRGASGVTHEQSCGTRLTFASAPPVSIATAPTGMRQDDLFTGS